MMQVLPAPVDPVSTNDRIDFVAMLLVKLIPVITKVGVGLANVDHLKGDKLKNNDVIEVADNRNAIGDDVFGVSEIDKGREQMLTIVDGKLPLLVD